MPSSSKKAVPRKMFSRIAVYSTVLSALAFLGMILWIAHKMPPAPHARAPPGRAGRQTVAYLAYTALLGIPPLTANKRWKNENEGGGCCKFVTRFSADGIGAILQSVL